MSLLQEKKFLKYKTNLHKLRKENINNKENKDIG